MSGSVKARPKDLRRVRRRSTSPRCWDHLVIAPLWVAYGANLGSLARTCDAVGACIAVPNTAHYKEALARGMTLPRPPHIHWLDRAKGSWIRRQKADGWTIAAVELAEGAVPLPRLEAARDRTVILLGHEHEGVPEWVWESIDYVIEIPMVGSGASLNVAVAGSLALYRLAGLM